MQDERRKNPCPLACPLESRIERVEVSVGRIGDVDKTVTEVKALIAMRDTRSQDMKETLDQIRACLIGTGDPEKPSVINRIDRLEQTNENQKVVYGSIILLMVNATWNWLKGK